MIGEVVLVVAAGAGKPASKIASLIDDAFGSDAAFAEQFKAAAVASAAAGPG